MTHVRMLVQVTGTRNGSAWPAAGETADLPEAEARRLVDAGHAEPAGGDQPDPKRRARKKVSR